MRICGTCAVSALYFALGCNAGPNSGSASTVVAASAQPGSTATGIAPQTASSSSDPAWYATPAVVGATNVVSVAAGSNLQAALSAAKPGDVIELAPGTYPAKFPGIEVSGTASRWIVIRSAAGGRATIDLENAGELHVGASYCLVENIEVVNGAGNNIHVVPAKAGITNLILRNVHSHAMASGTGAALKIAGNWNNGTGLPTEYVYLEGCEFSGSLGNAVVDGVACRHTVLRDCFLHDPVNGSLTSPGVFFKGGSSDILIDGNLIKGIRGTGAIMVGGDTGAQWFDALYSNPKIEGVNQVIRNNVLADFDDSAFEIRGTKGAKIYGNTIVAQTSFAIFRLTWGGQGSGVQIGNYEIDAENNLILASGSPRYAQNDGNTDATVTFGPQLWGGRLGAASGPKLPGFPQPGDKTVGAGSFGAVVLNPSSSGLTSRADAALRFALAPASPAKGAGKANTFDPKDFNGTGRAATPSLGAFE